MSKNHPRDFTAALFCTADAVHRSARSFPYRGTVLLVRDDIFCTAPERGLPT